MPIGRPLSPVSIAGKRRRDRRDDSQGNESGVLEVFLVFRFVLKLTGASLTSSFVGLIYGLTGILIMPFEGIFRRGFTQGLETTSVLEPATLVAMVVYLVLGWGIVKLIRIFSGAPQVEQ